MKRDEEVESASYRNKKVRVKSRVFKETLTETVVIHAILFIIMWSSKQ